MKLTGPQIDAAIALAKTTQDVIATEAGIARSTLNKIITESSFAQEETERVIRHKLESRGIEFIGNVGVQYARHEVRSLIGVDGLKSFFDDVRATVRQSDDEIVICGVEEAYLEKKLREYLDHHRKEMADIGNVKMRCIIKEGDPNVGASEYCQYRWQPKESFSNVPFYIYGDKMAIIVTSGPEDPLTLLIHNRTIAQAYRGQFEYIWNASKEIVKGNK